MLLHYAIRKVENNTNPAQEDFKNSTTIDFDLKKPNSVEKFVYPVFGRDCKHLDVPIDLPDVVKGYNSCKREYVCQNCNTQYIEVDEFWPHPLFSKVRKEFNPLVEKITILHGFLLCNIKRAKKRFAEPLSSNKLKPLITKLLTKDENDQTYRDGQFFALLEKNQQFKLEPKLKFQSLCLLDNVNIVIPVRHRNCQHISAYELTSLITYQIENYEQLKPAELKEKESNKYLRCMEQQCKSRFPLQSKEELFGVLVLDFEFLDNIKLGYPGNFLYVATKQLNQIKLRDYVSSSDNNNQDDYIRNYWLQNKRIKFNLIANQFVKDATIEAQETARVSEIEKYLKEEEEKQKAKLLNSQNQNQTSTLQKQGSVRLGSMKKIPEVIAQEKELQELKRTLYLEEYTTQEQFQKLVLEKMVAVMNQDLHKTVKEKINIYKYGIYSVNLKDQSQSNYQASSVEYPARCINCPIEKVANSVINNIDIRTMIAYILHRQIVAKADNNQNQKVRCPLCQTEFKKSAAAINFTNDLIYYDSQLYARMQQQIQQIQSNPEKVMKYNGEGYLLADFQNKWCFTLQHFKEQANQSEIYFRSKNCPILTVFLKEPLINFRCKNQTRISFKAFYLKFRDNSFKLNPGLQLCKCVDQGCQLVDEIEGQLYFDHLFLQAYSKKELHQECNYGFSYNIETEKVTELKQNDAFFTNLVPPYSRHVVTEQEQEQE